ncbi:uncharacterized protein LOC135215906 [Macrobrachium nipponense]|uniref:uncharacterized protein LOC135215906 n=1 Tax=Macrobrachium nipponense TaxID=159736 RepID=UPI0030C7B424
MGSPLGVLFANFYMGAVERRVFATIEKLSMRQTTVASASLEALHIGEGRDPDSTPLKRRHSFRQWHVGRPPAGTIEPIERTNQCPSPPNTTLPIKQGSSSVLVSFRHLLGWLAVEVKRWYLHADVYSGSNPRAASSLVEPVWGKVWDLSSMKNRTVTKKLVALNGGKIHLPQGREEYINLTDHVPTPEDKILRMGLNCHFITQPRPMDKRLEIEYLLDGIQKQEDLGNLQTTNALQPLLLAEVLTDHGDYRSEEILADTTKFSRITKNPVNDIKQGNPLRPIISQIPAPTYLLAKKLNTILTLYVLDTYSLKSSAEFLEDLRVTPAGGCIASMDMESLFTNVPVDETIQMILDKVYRDPDTPPLNIPEHALRALLEICTKKAPFSDPRGCVYTQIDGVVMGSLLGVLFANFYMGTVKGRVFQNSSKPRMYVRYIDDTFVSANSREEIEQLQCAFHDHSCLSFTIEHCQDHRLPFPNVLVE